MTLEADIKGLFQKTGLYIRASEAVRQIRRYDDPLVRRALILRTILAKRAAAELEKGIQALMVKYNIPEAHLKAGLEAAIKRVDRQREDRQW